MPNFLAYAVLYLWPLVGLYIYKRYEQEKAISLLLFIPYLFLPAGAAIVVPVLPPMEKEVIAGLLLWWVICRSRKSYTNIPDEPMSKVFLFLLIAAPFLTAFTNREPLYYGDKIIPGLTVSAALQLELSNVAGIVAPFIAGYFLINDEEKQKVFLKYFFIFGMIYSVFMLYEIRMSPRLQAEIYGFFPHSFAQQVRYGGYRPTVFLGHGLYVAFFFCMACLVALYLYKTKQMPRRFPPLATVAYMALVLLFCKTVSAFFYFVLFGFAYMYLPMKIRNISFALVAAMLINYPVLRGEIIPVDGILSFVQEYRQDKVGSLKFRFDNEEILLEKAMARKYFGWGGSGRNFVYDTYSGNNISVVDGQWIIVFGVTGWLGYLALFGLVAYPLIKFALNYKIVPKSELPTKTILAILLSANLIDLIPNSSFMMLTPFIAGSLIGSIRLIEKGKHTASTAPQNPELVNV